MGSDQWWTRAPAVLVRPMFAVSEVFSEWTTCVANAKLVVKKKSESTGASLCLRWREVKELCDQDFMGRSLRSAFGRVAEYFCGDALVWVPESGENSRPYGSWHDFAVSLYGEIHVAALNVRGHAGSLAEGLVPYTESVPSRDKQTGRTMHGETWRVRAMNGDDPIPLLNLLAETIIYWNKKINVYLPPLENSHGFLRELQLNLERECKRAWLTWRQLPDYRDDPAAKERITDAEAEAIEDAASNHRVKAWARKRNAKWLDWYEEFVEANEAQPNVAIIERWNALSGEERLKIAGNQRGAMRLPTEASSDQTKARQRVAQVVQRAKRKRNGAASGEKKRRCL